MGGLLALCCTFSVPGALSITLTIHEYSLHGSAEIRAAFPLHLHPFLKDFEQAL